MTAALLLAASLGALAGPATAQGFGGEPKARLELVPDHTSYSPGSPARLAARVSVEPGWHLNSNTPSFEWLIPTELELDLPDGWPEATVRYPDHELKTFAFEDEPLAVYDGEVVILADLFIPETVAQDQVRLEGVLSFQACDDRQCLPPTEVRDTLDVAIGAPGEPVDPELFEEPTTGGGTATGSGAGPGPQGGSERGSGGETGSGAGGPAAPGLAAMLLLGVLGGLILNAMPCVLPVLSLKVFGLVKSAGEGRAAVTGGSFATAAGILLS
ncbi:MAG: protein-disulfide reductase DsbD domain-containing protein, partial [Actinomycetota bacterium]